MKKLHSSPFPLPVSSPLPSQRSFDPGKSPWAPARKPSRIHPIRPHRENRQIPGGVPS